MDQLVHPQPTKPSAVKPLFAAIRIAAIGLAVSLSPLAIAEAVNTAIEYRYEISAGSLEAAIDQFARTAGVNLNYQPEQLANKTSAGLQGSFSHEQALNKLLLGTGLKAEPSAGGFNIKPSKAHDDLYTLTPVNVYGRKKGDQIGTIPQTVSVLGDDNLALSSAKTVGDALESIAGASRTGSALDMFSENYQIRGFDAEQSTNGLGFKRTDHPTDLANVERIEVLKGPSSVLYGQMEPGGTINVVTKQPLDEFQADADIELGSYKQQRMTLDVTGPVNEDIRARLNVAYQDNESSLDALEYQRFFIAPNVTFDLTETSNLTIEGSYSKNEWTAMHGGAPIEGAITANPHGDYAKSFNPASSDSFTDRDSKDLNIRFTEALTDKIDARLSYSYTHNTADWAEYVNFGLADDNRTLSRLVFAGKDTYKKDHEFIMDLTGEVDIANLEHNFIVGVNYRDSKVFRPNQLFFAQPIDLFNPQYSPMNLSSSTMIRDRTLEQNDEVFAAFLQDRITLNDKLQVLAGLRYTDVEQSQVYTTHSSGNSQSKDSLSVTNWSSQFGVIYALTDTTSVFANRSEAFVPQQGTTSGLTPLKPEESTQYEAGVRMKFSNIEVNLAGFSIEKENMAIADPLDDDFEVAHGSARSKGIELSVGGYMTPNWYLNASYGYTDTEILNSDDLALEGNRFANVPLHSASVQSRYHLASVPGLTLGGLIRYQDDRYGDDDNSYKLPSYVRLDLTANYIINDEVELDLFIDNALDEEIFAAGSFDGVVREPGRTFTARLKYQF